ncbi:MAG TPA: CpsD/CapB family tyrosine-protein kinase [Terriglobales bacterium]|nr:CpsD/CapB family tyrosine-protein kinase [Terriglobales bacterium]
MDGKVEHWLEQIQKSVDEQVSGVSLAFPPTDAAPAETSRTEAAPPPPPPEIHADLAAVGFDRFATVHLPSRIERAVLPTSDGNDEAAREAYGVLRTRLLRRHAVTGIRTLAITSSVKGEGKTVTTLNLAMSCAQVQGMTILAVDGDLRSCGLSSSMGLSESNGGLAKVLKGSIPYEAAVLATNINNLYVLPSGMAGSHPAELYQGAALRNFLAWCKGRFKMVLVDCPPVVGLADSELITAACDGILFVARSRQTQPALLKQALGQLEQKKIVGVVFNGGQAHKYGYGYNYAYTNRGK